MAVVTKFELIDFLENGSNDLYINATDKDGVQRVVSSADNTKRYFIHKYGTRMYPVLTGMHSASVSDALTNFVEDFRAWVSNRQRNIDLQYQALYDYDYSPIDNYDRYETENIDDDGTTTYGRRDAESGSDTFQHGHSIANTGTTTTAESGSDALQHGHSIANTGTTTTADTGTDTTTKSGNIVNETDKAGFNSPNTFTNDTKNTETFNSVRDATAYGKTETQTDNTQEAHSGTDTTTYGKTETQTDNTHETHTGTDTTTYGKTTTQSGSDSTTKDIERSLHAYGNIGVTTATSMISELIEARMMSLADMLLDNFINDYTYYS